MATNVEMLVNEFIERTGGVGGGTIMTGEEVKKWMDEAIKRNSNGDGPTDRETIYTKFREMLDRLGIYLEAPAILGSAPKDPIRYALGLEDGDTPKASPHKMSIEGLMADIQKAVERRDAREVKSPQELLMESLRSIQTQAKMELLKRMDRQAKMLDELLTLCEECGMKLTPKAGVEQQFEEWVKFLRERLSQKSPLPFASVAGSDPSLGREDGRIVGYLADILNIPAVVPLVVDAVREMKAENGRLNKAKRITGEILKEFGEGMQKMQKRYESEVG